MQYLSSAVAGQAPGEITLAMRRSTLHSEFPDQSAYNLQLVVLQAFDPAEQLLFVVY